MAELIRDTTLGKLLRLITGGKVMRYAEERDSELWKRYLNTEKSGRMAHHGTTEEEKDGNANSDDAGSDYTERRFGEQKDESDSRPIGTGTNEPYMDTNPEARRRGTGGHENESHSPQTGVDSGENRQTNDASGVAVDPEKGRDVSVVDWYGDADPEVLLVLLPPRQSLADCCRTL